MKSIAGYWRFLLLGLAALSLQSVFADSLRETVVVGNSRLVEQRDIQLQPGIYSLQLLHLFSGDVEIDPAVLLADADIELARISFAPAAGTTSKVFSVSEAAEVKLYVNVAGVQDHGPVIVSLVSSDGAQTVFEEPFVFSRQNLNSDHYIYAATLPVTTTEIGFDLVDFGARFNDVLPLSPFENISVQLLNVVNSQVTFSGCWYRGLLPKPDCQSLDASPEPGLDLQTAFQASAGTLSVYIEASRADQALAQLGWSLHQTGDNQWLDGDNVMVNAGEAGGTEIAQFDLPADLPVQAKWVPASSTMSEFQLSIVSSASTSSITLNNSITNANKTLPQGRYKIKLLNADDGEGLAGLYINSGNTVLYDEGVSLGNFQKLGEFNAAQATTTQAGLHFIEGAGDTSVVLVGGGIANPVLGSMNLSNPALSIKQGHHSVWASFAAGAADDLYHLTLGAEASPLFESYGTTGSRLVSHDRYDIIQTGKIGLSVRNYAFPDVFTERYRIILAQGDTAPLKIDFDAADDIEVREGIPVKAGPLHVVIHAQQSADSANVLGYRLSGIASEPVPDPTTPPRGANGSGKGGGGGSFSSFFLYLLLVVRFLHTRKH